MVGEFTEYGFSVETRFVEGLSEEEVYQFLDDWIDSAIEANGLSFGGGTDTKTHEGYVVPNGRGTATEYHRHIIDDWLSAHPKIRFYTVGPLTDTNK